MSDGSTLCFFTLSTIAMYHQLYFPVICARYEELCTFLTEQVPHLKAKTKMIVSDGLFLPDERSLHYFPFSFHLDNSYHMVNVNCVRHCPPYELLGMKPLVWKMVKTYDEDEFYECMESLKSNCPNFFSRYFYFHFFLLSFVQGKRGGEQFESSIPLLVQVL